MLKKPLQNSNSLSGSKNTGLIGNLLMFVVGYLAASYWPARASDLSADSRG
jgi:hypothetical protein